ncbi:hypothetical protein M6D81_10920 [Paenibacillus sp. J5C_2022]|uniref:hypothetical protein n=1 Tax=Paenibacillus sp. J5C2022 TaxID=2977129 RepID=UPI0021D34FC0|nr:hypothetical protein [Paenibacillus sp. J5C2022]MCU6709220.1 hypothetical protein [Paenibacillus sp. J5C2022]
MKRLMWVMDDETFDQLFKVMKVHLELAKEHGHKDTSRERRQAIMLEIEGLRQQRVRIITNYINSKGEI